MKKKKSKKQVKSKPKKQTKKQTKKQVKSKPKKQVKSKPKKQIKSKPKKQTKKQKILALKIDKLKKIDKRRLTKEQKKYIKTLLQEHKRGEFEKKFTKYLANAVEIYLKNFNFSTKLKDMSKLIGMSESTYKKIKAGKKVSKKTYKKFMNFITTQFSSDSQTVLWQILNHLKAYGRISEKKLRQIINEIIQLNQELEIKLNLYDTLRVYY
jgi:hypothetical protein